MIVYHTIYCQLNLNLGFSKERIRLFLIYLTNRTQRIKIGSTFIDRANIVKGIPHSSILSPLLFSYFSMICSFSQKNVKPVTLLMTLDFILVVFIQITCSQTLYRIWKTYMNGLYTIQLKQILIDFNLLLQETQDHIHCKSIIKP